MRKIGRWAIAGVIVGTLLYLNNSSLLASRPSGDLVLLAHRGISQQFDRRGVGRDTCTASRMLPPTHAFLENTIASMQASFAAGADVVELDVHPTTDGQFAVFHDWTIDCRTDGQGVTREKSMAELKRLDIGYGYTADGGQTFPFRGKFVGMMPSLQEVLSAFPGRAFLINIKSNDPKEGELLAEVLKGLAPGERSSLMVYGGDQPIATFRQLMPDTKTLSRAALKSCLYSYLAYGWTGIVPKSCTDMIVFVPANWAPWLWGWPDRFLNRMASVNSAVFLIGPYHGGDYSTGIDTKEQALALPKRYSGGVMTNEIELIAPLIKPQK